MPAGPFCVGGRMMDRGGLSWRSAGALGAGLLLSACAFAPQLQRVAVDQDQMVAQTEDELMLRNILRARDRYPLHFTTITQVNGSASLEVGGSLGGTITARQHERALGDTGRLLGSAVTGTGAEITPELSGRVSTTPSYTSTVLATDAFQRGIQQPLRPDLIAYYLDAGWRDELLMALFIERLDIVDRRTNRRLASIHNEPSEAYRFQEIICHFALAPRRTDQPVIIARGAQLFDPAGVPSLANPVQLGLVKDYVALLNNEQIALERGGPDNEQLVLQPGARYSVTLVPRPDRCAGERASARKQDWRRRVGADYELTRGEMRNGAPVLLGSDLLDERLFRNLDSSGNGLAAVLDLDDGRAQALHLAGPEGRAQTEVSIDIFFRSVQDVIYFLGEYVRTGDAAYQIPLEYYLSGCAPAAGQPLRQSRWLLRIEEGAGPGAMATRFLGRRYFIPDANGSEGMCGGDGGEESRGTQVIALLQQLLNLNKSSDQLPNSISVRAIP